MDVTLLTGIVGALFSLLAGYVPKFSQWFDGLETVYKRLLMVGLALVASLAVVGMACAGVATVFGLTVTCDQVGVVAVLKAFGVFMMANQATYQLMKKSYNKAKV